MRAVSAPWLERIAAHCRDAGLVLHVHADEQPREIEECVAEHGLRPVELLDRCGALGPRTTIVHGTHCDDRELALLARSTHVFADFPPGASDEDDLQLVTLPERSPLLREWAVVCDATEAPIALTAWEVPGQVGVPELRRVFEATWTMVPSLVREAARVWAVVTGAEKASAVRLASTEGVPAEESPLGAATGRLETLLLLDAAAAEALG